MDRRVSPVLWGRKVRTNPSAQVQINPAVFRGGSDCFHLWAGVGGDEGIWLSHESCRNLLF